MSYKVFSISLFDKQAKRLIKKYPSPKLEISDLAKRLKVNPDQGVPLKNNFYKIRLAVKSKGEGKIGRGASSYLCKSNPY